MMMVRALGTALVAAPLAMQPRWGFFIAQRLVQMFTYNLMDTAVRASLADAFVGKQLAVAAAQIESCQGVAMLLGPVVGGRLAERSPRMCYALSAAAGLASTGFVTSFSASSMACVHKNAR